MNFPVIMYMAPLTKINFLIRIRCPAFIHFLTISRQYQMSLKPGLQKAHRSSSAMKIN